MRKIRPIEAADTDAVLEMARLMHAESPRFRGMTFVDAKALAIIAMLVERGGGFVAEEEEVLVGMIGGLVVEQFFSHDKFATDLVVYVVPERRGGPIAMKLVKLFEDWAFAQEGVNEVLLGISTGVMMKATVCVYERLGYTMASHSLLKSRGVN